MFSGGFSSAGSSLVCEDAGVSAAFSDGRSVGSGRGEEILSGAFSEGFSGSLSLATVRAEAICSDVFLAGFSVAVSCVFIFSTVRGEVIFLPSAFASRAVGETGGSGFSELCLLLSLPLSLPVRSRPCLSVEPFRVDSGLSGFDSFRPLAGGAGRSFEVTSTLLSCREVVTFG